jgi:hypothetical protein
MKKKFLRIPVIILAGIAIIFLACFAMMYLWNLLMPEIFHLPSITYWQAFGLFILSRFLFGGMKFHEKGHFRKDRRNEIWHEKFDKKLASLGPEEREKFMETWRKHCGSEFGPQSSVNP